MASENCGAGAVPARILEPKGKQNCPLPLWVVQVMCLGSEGTKTPFHSVLHCAGPGAVSRRDTILPHRSGKRSHVPHRDKELGALMVMQREPREAKAKSFRP